MSFDLVPFLNVAAALALSYGFVDLLCKGFTVLNATLMFVGGAMQEDEANELFGVPDEEGGGFDFVIISPFDFWYMIPAASWIIYKALA